MRTSFILRGIWGAENRPKGILLSALCLWAESKTKLLVVLMVLGELQLSCASEIASSAELQNWARVSAQITVRAELNAPQVDGTTALHWAAYHENAHIVTQLLSAGANADPANRYGITPLLLSCQSGNESIVRALLDAGADVNAKQHGGETALMIASRTGKAGAVKALIDKGAKIDAEDRAQQTALMWAAAEGHSEVIELLVQNGANVKHRLDSGFTALLFAAREGKAAAVEKLLQHGSEVTDAIVTEDKVGGRDAPNGTSAVLLAMENGHFGLALEILMAGADPNDKRSGFTALHALTWVRRPPHGDDETGQAPPDTHGKLGSLEFARAIITAGADPNATLPKAAKARASGSINFTGATPFLLACRNADLPLMKLLVEMGADPHRTNVDGSTPLMAAAGLGCYAPDEEAGTEDECVAACDYLLSLGADVNAIDKKSQTAMHGAAYKSLPKVAKLLASKGAKIDVWNQKNNSGWTPLLIAQGFRPGNFKPSAPTIATLIEIMVAAGVKPPPAPARDALPKKKGYDNP